jgi:hypothetical protein
MKKMIAGFLFLSTLMTLPFIFLSQHILFAQAKAALNITSVNNIPLPVDYKRMNSAKGSFGEWLQHFALRKDNIVRMYNGEAISRQELHYAVLNISTGNKNLQQCADAIMRLRAEYYFERKEYNKISFTSSQHHYNFADYASKKNYSHECLMQFMENVFINCGTYTVDEMTNQIALHDIQPGDVFVKAGAPGHAMIVMDVAINLKGDKIYLLAQSYMPAQDMHIVINPNSSLLSPWYKADELNTIITPGWTFFPTQLKRWK